MSPPSPFCGDPPPVGADYIRNLVEEEQEGGEEPLRGLSTTMRINDETDPTGCRA